MSTADILAELPRLSPAELAAVQAKLDELTGPATTAMRGQRAADAARRDVEGYAAHPVTDDEFAVVPGDLTRADDAAW